MKWTFGNRQSVSFTNIAVPKHWPHLSAPGEWK
jgi:hypothetical protein